MIYLRFSELSVEQISDNSQFYQRYCTKQALTEEQAESTANDIDHLHAHVPD